MSYNPANYPIFDSNVLRGSLLMTFNNLYDNPDAYYGVVVNGIIKDQEYVDTNNFFSTYLYVGDVVTITIYDALVPQFLSINRTDYSTDNSIGLNGINTVFVTGVTSTNTITFTVESLNTDYNFEYKIDLGASIPPTPTPTPTITPTNTVTPTITPTKTVTPTITPTLSITPTNTNTPTNTITPTPTKTVTPTNTITPSVTMSPSISPTPTNTNTPTNSVTPTVTPTNTITPTITPTNTVTPTITPTNTVTPTVTPTLSITPTNTNTPTNTLTPTPSGLPNDGTYVLVNRDYNLSEGGTSRLYLSTNRGNTFSLLTSPFTGYTSYYDVAMSRDGQYQTVCNGPDIYYSNNYGASFSTSTTPTGNTYGNVYVSENGQYQAATRDSTTATNFFFGSDDYGVTFVRGTGPFGTFGNAIGTGVFITNSGILYSVSRYNGSTYPRINKLNGIFSVSGIFSVGPAGGRDYTGIDGSNDGQYVTAVNNLRSGIGGTIAVSSNNGSSWTETSLSLSEPRVAVSQTGQYQIVSDKGGYLYLSSNYGVTWTSITSMGTQNWYDVAISPYGDVMIASIYNPTLNPGTIAYLYRSLNYGATWSSITTAGEEIWRKIAMGGY